jgi:hypothetical protein
MTGTVRIGGVACGIIADMVRLMVGLTAWMAGTAIAVSVAWLGANVVVRNAGVGPGMPVINPAVLPSAAASLPPTTPPAVVTPTASGGGTAPRHAVVTPSAGAAGPSAASPSAGDVRAYTLAGGNVTLEVTGDTAQLITAVPDAGYSVMTWSGTDWLRVDFSSGAQVSSLIASWYQHAPAVTVEN